MDFKPGNAVRRAMAMREKPTQKSPDEEEGSDDNAVAEEEAVDAEEKKQKRLSSGGRRVAGGGISCQAEKCTADLTEAKRYHRRHKVCEFHAKAPSVLVSGLRQRFCQQCSRSLSPSIGLYLLIIYGILNLKENNLKNSEVLKYNVATIYM